MSTSTDHTHRRLPLSVPNIVIGSVGVTGTIVTAVTHNVWGAAFIGVITVIGLICALAARGPHASDLTRINAIEYRDERDRQLATYGFAVVGAVALCLAVAESVTAIILAGTVFGLRVGSVVVGVVAAQQLVLYLVWGIANIRAVRRG